MSVLVRGTWSCSRQMFTVPKTRCCRSPASTKPSMEHSCAHQQFAGGCCSLPLVTCFCLSKQISPVSTDRAGPRWRLLEGRVLLTLPNTQRCDTDPSWLGVKTSLGNDERPVTVQAGVYNPYPHLLLRAQPPPGGAAVFPPFKTLLKSESSCEDWKEPYFT